MADIYCEYDASDMKKVGINVVHVWYLDVTSSHAACFKTYQDLGIYVIIQIQHFQYLNDYWNYGHYNELNGLIDSVASFPNVLGFVFADRRKASDDLAGPQPKFANVKAKVRDVKLYMRESGYRQIPVGVAGTARESNAIEATYLLCGDATEQKIDFWMQFLPSACALKNNTALISSPSIYDTYGIPLLLSDFTCDEKTQDDGSRQFSELPTLYGPELSEVVSMPSSTVQVTN